MKIAVVGTGYVGLVSGVCFSEIGVDVTCVDTDIHKIEQLQAGVMPIFEPRLKEMVRKNITASRLHFSTSLPNVLQEVEIVFIAVGTPPTKNGTADLSAVYQVARTIGENLDHYVVVVTKSTVPVGTSKEVQRIIQQELTERQLSINFDVSSNPEFLKEGAAIKDFMSPDRVVIGVESERAKNMMSKLYRPFLLNNFRVLFMDIPSAEMTKYAANSMLATRISFMNDMANLCELVGADVNMVRKGIGTDQRIGNKFLYAGCGYGGSCFPKDVQALIHTAHQHGYPMRLLEAVEEVNQNQKKILFKKLQKRFGQDLSGKTIAVWGLAFKPNTDDLRQAISKVLIQALLDAGAKVRAFDPIVKALPIQSDDLYFASDAYDAAFDADAICLVTEWQEFRLPNWQIIKKSMKRPVIIDGRNIYDKLELQSLGFEYQGVGI